MTLLFKMKLAQHTYSGLFGSFLFNTIKDAAKSGCAILGSHSAVENSNGSVANGGHQSNGAVNGEKCEKGRCYTIWDYLGKHNFEFVNPAYEARCRANARLDRISHLSGVW